MCTLCIHILGTTCVTEPNLPEATVVDLTNVPLLQAEHHFEDEDPLLLGDVEDYDDEHAVGPAIPKPEPASLKPKKRRVTYQDIQAMQLGVLKVEKQ